MQETEISEEEKKTLYFKLQTKGNVEGKDLYIYDDEGNVFDLSKVRKNIFMINNKPKEEKFYFIDINESK